MSELGLRVLGGGRYVLGPAIGSGGMCRVHLARQVGPLGHSRVVAVKRLRPELARDPEHVAMLMDEARLTARVQHASVVPIVDFVADGDELFLVLEYVPGAPLSYLASAMRQAKVTLPTPVVVAIGADLLEGLHAIHDATDDAGKPLSIVHRDVSPQNVIVGLDGVARIHDLGVAKAAHRAQTTRGGELKGKLAYMAPEQLELRPTDRRSDVYSAAVVIWELCSGRRLHAQEAAGELLDAIEHGPEALSSLRDERDALGEPTLAVERELRRALAFDAADRHESALSLSRALQQACPAAPRFEVREWASRLAHGVIDERASLVRGLEQGRTPTTSQPLPSTEPETVRSDRESNPDSQTGVTAAVSRSVRRPPPSVLAALAILALGVAAGALFSGGTHPAPPAPAARAPESSVALPAPGPEPRPHATPAPSPAPAPVASVPAQTARVKSAVPAPARKAAPAPSACAPPYRVDAAGVRVYKEECL
jgi:serine/threonine protein kinase